MPVCEAICNVDPRDYMVLLMAFMQIVILMEAPPDVALQFGVAFGCTPRKRGCSSELDLQFRWLSRLSPPAQPQDTLDFGHWTGLAVASMSF